MTLRSVSWLLDKQERDNGKLIRYFRSGRLKEMKNYKDGKLDGSYVLYQDNNTNDIIESSFYKMGKKSYLSNI